MQTCTNTSRGRPAEGLRVGSAGLQSQAIFMGHIRETGGEEPCRKDLKSQTPNEYESFREKTSLLAMIFLVTDRGGGGAQPNKSLKRSTVSLNIPLLSITPQLKRLLLKVCSFILSRDQQWSVVSLNLCWLQWIVHFHSGEKSSKHPQKLSQSTLPMLSDSPLSVRMLSVFQIIIILPQYG